MIIILLIRVVAVSLASNNASCNTRTYLVPVCDDPLLLVFDWVANEHDSYHGGLVIWSPVPHINIVGFPHLVLYR